jgi:phage baseplate assembly protein W
MKDGEYLPDYDQSDGALIFRKNLAPHHVVIPRLDEEYVTELERLDLSVADVLTASNGKSSCGKDVGPVLRQLMVKARLRRFQQNIYEQLGPALQALSI